MAIELRKLNQCDIRLPPWMAMKELKQVLQKEKTDMESFQPLPFHYVEVRVATANSVVQLASVGAAS